MPLDARPDPRETEVAPERPVLPFNGIALVGEAPGDTEVERMRPFCGASGRVLDAVLRASGIERKECWVGNVFSTKLDENEVKAERARRGAGWDAFWQGNIARLHAELVAVRPTVVVALGGTALLALAGTPSIAKMRGQPMMGTGLFKQFKLLPTYHPAFILRQWDFYNIAIGDMQRALAERDRGPSIIWPHRTLYVAPSLAEVEAHLPTWCAQAGPDNPLSCDIETGWGMVRGVAFAPSQLEAMYVPFISLNTLSRSYWHTFEEEKRAWLAVKAALESPCPKLGQNYANYDAIWLLTKMGIRTRGFTHDLRLLHKALYPELPASLGFMGAAYASQGSWKAWSAHAKATGDNDAEKRDA